MGTKNNPGNYDCHTKADDDEPLFTLLARDPHAPVLVRLWADLRALHSGNPSKVAEARDCAVAMEAWHHARRSRPRRAPVQHSSSDYGNAGIERIARERRRQIEELAWDETNDSSYFDQELLLAAACYALFDSNVSIAPVATVQDNGAPAVWPFERSWWKPSPTNDDDKNRLRRLEKAGALIAAEIDRLLALEDD